MTWRTSCEPPAGTAGTRVATQDDSYGYRWMVLRNPDGAPSVEDLAVGINAVSSSIETAGPRRAIAVRGVRLHRRAEAAGVLHLQLQARLLVPVRARTRGIRTTNERATERELQLKAQMAAELPIEPELERWFPLWGIPI